MKMSMLAVFSLPLSITLPFCNKMAKTSPLAALWWVQICLVAHCMILIHTIICQEVRANYAINKPLMVGGDTFSWEKKQKGYSSCAPVLCLFKCTHPHTHTRSHIARKHARNHACTHLRAQIYTHLLPRDITRIFIFLYAIDTALMCAYSHPFPIFWCIYFFLYAIGQIVSIVAITTYLSNALTTSATLPLVLGVYCQEEPFKMPVFIPFFWLDTYNYIHKHKHAYTHKHASLNTAHTVHTTHINSSNHPLKKTHTHSHKY